MTPVGATCGPTSETFCGRGQGECLAQGGPHVDSLSDHRAGHGTFSGGRWGWRGSHESCSVPLYPVRFLHASPRLSLKRPGPARPLGLRPALPTAGNAVSFLLPPATSSPGQRLSSRRKASRASPSPAVAARQCHRCFMATDKIRVSQEQVFISVVTAASHISMFCIDSVQMTAQIGG